MRGADVATASPPAGDLRGFVYALDPVVRQHEWAYEAELGRLGQAQRLLADARGALETQLQEQAAQAALAQELLRQRGDPQAYRLVLSYLAEVQGGIVAARSAVQRREAECTEVRNRCLVLHRKIDGFAQDRVRCQREHVQEQARRAEVEADRDWIARGAWRPRPFDDVLEVSA